jgi:hypothetical protein
MDCALHVLIPRCQEAELKKVQNKIRVSFGFPLLSQRRTRSVGECALCRQSLRKEALDEVLRVREPGAVQAEEQSKLGTAWHSTTV